MGEKKYTEEHEWVQLTGDIATVGITCLLYTSDAADE